jgi:predicted alpha/beta superfamily hydrolase
MKHLIPTLLLVASALPVAAQVDSGVPLERARTFSIQSKALGQTRMVDVSLPGGYGRSDRRYPVVYVLDGEFEQELAAAIVRYYSDAGKVPPMIVLGIRNPDRMHELTPAPAGSFQAPAEASSAGGAEKFLRFVGEELIPWVNGRFATDSMRILVGHSLGGLFALYTLANRPTLFTGWILMEPSAWWNRGLELDKALAVLKSPAGRHARVMAVNMQGLRIDTTRWGGDGPMVRELATIGENHTSMALQGLAHSLRTMFADFLPAEWRPGTRPIAMLALADSLTVRLGYPVPIPQSTLSTVARMSIDARYYDDAVRVLERLERTYGAGAESQRLRQKLAEDRANPAPGFVQLEFPARRPTVTEARGFLGRWKADGDLGAEVLVRQSGDSIVVHELEWFPDGMPWEGDRPVVQITSDGTLEWGSPVFRGLAALLILRGRVQPDGTMRVTRQVRGWVPLGPGPDLTRVETYRRISP